jgi:fibronectin type 3 domain-containing protein
VLLLSSVLPAFVVNRDPHELARATVVFAEGHIPSDTVSLENVNLSLVGNYAAYQNFMGRYGTGWSIFLDGQTGRPGYIGGEGIPMIPGLGNTLTMGDIRLLDAGPRKKPTVQDVDALVRAFFAENAGLFQVEDRDLVLLPASGFYGDGDYLCFLNYQVTYQGVPIEGAILQARLNHGNLVDMGFTGNYARPAIPALATLSVQDAMGALGRHIGGFRPDDMFLQAGTLKFVPYYLGEGKPFGQRVGHRLIYEFAFQRPGVSALWRGWVDAHSGRVIKFEDATDYATYQRIRAQVYPEHIGGGSSLVERSLAFAREENFDLCSTTSGLYPYPGGTAKCTLNMTEHPTGGCTYAWTNEMCGTAPNLSSATGDLNFGGTTAQDCSYTGASFGNATEAGIMGLYHVTIEKVTALTYLPANTWLNNTLEFESNYNSQCNANWDGTDLTMYRSGSTGGSACNNSGLIAGIFLHEFGHGLDANDGLASTDRGSGEAYGDSCGMIQTQNSCIGDYFWATDRNCGPNAGYGNQCDNCGGVRELDYMEKARNTPSTVQNWVCTDCWSSSYSDPCGYEGHCTSAGMGEAMWDLPVRDLTGVSGMSAATAWERFARIFYLSRPTSGKFYECTTASQCSNWTSNGCQSANWYRTMRVVDDDNGNLCDGTPNAAAIYAAFNRHNIACPPGGSCPNENKNVSSCPSLAAPTLGNPSTGACQISLSWTDTTNATQYHIYRNEFGCNANFIRIATVADPQITYIDTDVSPGVTYYYMVQAATANAACTGAMSACKSATPSSCTTCVIPNAPTGVSCSGGSNQILVSWTAPSGTHDGYRVYRQKSGEFTWTNVSGNLGLVTSWTDTNLLCATDYRYKVVSFENTNGPCESADSALTAYCQSACGGCTAPGAPTLNSATGTCTGVDLAWSAGSGTTLSYNIYRVAGACGGSYSKIAGPITATTYSDTSAVAGTQYAYVVRGACDAAGATESPNSNCLTATRLAAPAAPTGVAATDNRCTDVQVTWNAVTGATSYNVLRGTTCGTVVTTFTGVTSPYTDTSAVAGTTYQYWVVAVNACGTSPNSACDAGVRLAAPAAPAAPTFTNVSCTTLTVNWTAVSGATAYDLYRRSGGCGTGSVIASNLAGTTYNDSGLTANTIYGYYLVAKNTCGSSAAGTCAAVTTTSVPAAPTGLTATGTCAAVDLAWTASAGATSYEIWRTTNSNCNTGMANIGTSATTTFSDTSAVAGMTYYYEVRAVNACGTSGDSACANAARLTVPGAPSITGITDESACAQSGIRIAYTGGSGATRHDLVRDGGVVVTGYASGALYNPGNTASHSYVVRAVNACGTTDSGSQSFSDANNSTTPTIAGPNANTCPDTTVTLTTEAGMSAYQWYLGGAPIGGANTNTYVVSATGTYTVSYINASGCTGTSAGHSVTITACAPHIQVDGAFDPLTTLAQACGDGDGYIEPGEQWTVRVRLANTGTLGATTVQADLAISAGSQVIAVISGNSGQYGDIPAGGTALTAPPYYQFEVPSGVVCPKDLIFDVVNLRSIGYTYPAEQPAFTVQVGAALSENAVLATTPLTASSGSATSNLTPAFTLGAADTATLAYAYSHSAGGGTATLFGPDDSPGDSANWTRTNFASQSEAHCTYSDAHARSNATTGTLELTNPVSTVGYTGITVRFGYRHTRVPGGPPQYGTLTLDWYDGTTWTNGAWTSAETETWVCDQQVVLPAGAEGKAGFKVRFRHSSNAAGKYSHVDYVRIEGTGAGSGDWTNNVMVELIDPSATATVLKAYGTADANPYNVQPYYTGAGTYQVRITENAGGTATLTTPAGQGMTVGLSECDTTHCGGTVPGEVDPTTNKFSDKDTLAWAAVTGADGYRVYRGILEDLPELLLNNPDDSCQVDVGAATVWDISAHIPPAPGHLYWYLITAYNGVGEGTAGYATGPTARVLNPSGSCP